MNDKKTFCKNCFRLKCGIRIQHTEECFHYSDVLTDLEYLNEYVLQLEKASFRLCFRVLKYIFIDNSSYLIMQWLLYTLLDLTTSFFNIVYWIIYMQFLLMKWEKWIYNEHNFIVILTSLKINAITVITRCK